MAYKIFTEENYFIIQDTVENKQYQGHKKDVLVSENKINQQVYDFTGLDLEGLNGINISEIVDSTNTAFTDASFKTFYKANTGNFRIGGSTPLPTVSNLQQVTNVGKTTTNSIVVQGIEISSNLDNSDIKIRNSDVNNVQIGSGTFNSSDSVFNCIQIGQSAGAENLKESTIQIGNQAGILNKGSICVQIGQSAGSRNIGESAIQIGQYAGGTDGASIGNSGNYCIQIGNRAGQENLGNNCIQIGNAAGSLNTFNNVIQFQTGNTISTAAATQNNQAVLQATQGRLLIDLSSIADNILSGTNTGDNAPNTLYDGGIKREIRFSVSGNVIALSAINTDYVYILAGSSTNIKLPNVNDIGSNMYTVKNRGAVNINVTFTSGQNADGMVLTTVTPNQSLSFVSDGNNYVIV